MTTRKIFELFVKNNTKGRDGITPNADFKRKYGEVSFEEAFESYLKEVKSFIFLKKKIDEFESFLQKEGARRIQSGISESRYYYYNGIKYRFSSHVYPTGSMTDKMMGIIDLAADPELINEISFKWE
ncbi:hypothetical protein [uncultured Parabacteroides sp.]|uniref:hypothetical protein n=1 Tax=uncultured Parabacteroides sp. TaxID=512312 RepID=UPI0025D603B0|nr:hypothetical protein [uncultured Parabacteroides sp.]